jgi:branched-chain amino acid transport system substrate-binding protein
MPMLGSSQIKRYNLRKEGVTMKKLIFISLMIFLGCALIFSGYAQAKKAPKEIRVGVPAPLTGMYAGFGEGYVFGMKAAVEDINKRGGVYIKEYDRKFPLKARTLAESLVVRDKVHFMASGDEPPPMHPGVSTVADRYKIPYVTSTGPQEPWMGMRMEVEGHWKYTWATGLFAIVTPAPAGDFRAKPGYTITDTWQAMLDLFGDKTNKKVAVFASDDPDGVGWYSLFPSFLEKLGYDVCGEEKKVGLAPMETTDFSSIVKQWKDYGCEILWGNAPAPFVGTLLRQCATLGFKPKMTSIGRAPLFYEDVKAWGGDIPFGIGVEIWWDPSFSDSPGIGGTTPQSLAGKWTKETGKQLNRGIGPGYRSVQVLIDAIKRAGTLDGEKVNAALAKTDLMTIGHRAKFDKSHFSRGPLVFGQWQKTDKPWVWECPVVFSKHKFIKATADPIFPIP